MSTQRERFEAAWKAGGDYVIWMFDRNERTGKYYSIKAQAAFEGFQLGEASGLERAAEVCDTSDMRGRLSRGSVTKSWRCYSVSSCSPPVIAASECARHSSACAAACKSCATEIRALMAQGEI